MGLMSTPPVNRRFRDRLVTPRSNDVQTRLKLYYETKKEASVDRLKKESKNKGVSYNDYRDSYRLVVGQINSGQLTYEELFKIFSSNRDDNNEGKESKEKEKIIINEETNNDDSKKKKKRA